MGDNFIMYLNVDSLRYATETNIILCAKCTSVKKIREWDRLREWH